MRGTSLDTSSSFPPTTCSPDTMSDSEEDYMSEKYLIQAEQHEKKQPQTYSERRKQATREHERKAYIAPRAQMEKKAREEGLNQSVSEDNKGMQMLMKMGFK